MTEINLLLSIYFEETLEEGLTTLTKLLAGSTDSTVTIFRSGKRQEYPAREINNNVEPFNFGPGSYESPRRRSQFPVSSSGFLEDLE